MKELTASKVKNTWMVSNGQTLREFAVSNGLKYETLRNHVGRGRTLTQALLSIGGRAKHKKILVSYNGKDWTINELADSPFNVAQCSAYVLRSRIIEHGWSLDRALSTPLMRVRFNRVYFHKGKVYNSKKQLCRELGLNLDRFNHYFCNLGFSLEDAINMSFTKEVKLLPYKGKNYTLKQLSLHPDNIHGLCHVSIRKRVLELKMSVEEAFSIPKRSNKHRVIEYRGKVYPNLFEFLRSLGLHNYHARLTTIYDDEMLIQQVEKLLSSK